MPTIIPRFRIDRDGRLQTSIVNDNGQREPRYAFLVNKEHYEWLLWLGEHTVPEDQVNLGTVVEQLTQARRSKPESWMQVRRVEKRPWWSPLRWLHRNKTVWRGEFD